MLLEYLFWLNQKTIILFSSYLTPQILKTFTWWTPYLFTIAFTLTLLGLL